MCMTARFLEDSELIASVLAERVNVTSDRQLTFPLEGCSSDTAVVFVQARPGCWLR